MSHETILKEFAEATIDNWTDPQDDLEPMTRDEAVKTLNEEASDYACHAHEWLIEKGLDVDFSIVVDYLDTYK